MFNDKLVCIISGKVYIFVFIIKYQDIYVFGMFNDIMLLLSGDILLVSGDVNCLCKICSVVIVMFFCCCLKYNQ